MNNTLITRRNLLKAMVAAALAGVIGVPLAWFNKDRIRFVSTRGAESLIRKRLAYLDLRISSEEFRQFFQEYQKEYRSIPRLWDYKSRGRWAADQERMVEKLITTFIISTDFFPNGADESKPVRYLSLYSPYKTPCYNPPTTFTYGPNA